MIINRLTGKINKLYYISVNPNLDKDLVYPVVPNNFLTKGKWEEHTIPRIKLYKTIDDAISGQFLGQKFEPGTVLCVYQAKGVCLDNLLETSLTTTPYRLLVDETWYTAPLRVEKLGDIQLNGIKGEETYHYSVRSTVGKLYRWDWELKKKPWEKFKKTINCS